MEDFYKVSINAKISTQAFMYYSKAQVVLKEANPGLSIIDTFLFCKFDLLFF